MLLTVNVVPFGDDREPQRRFVVTLEDVTERQRLEQEVHRAQKLESVGVLAGGIAHDFNNLLTGIMGNISLAQIDAPAGSQIAEALGEAEKASLQARELTRQLLTFSRGGAPVKRPLAVAETVSNAVQFALRGSSVRGVFTIPADLWAVDADQGQISQVHPQPRHQRLPGHARRRHRGRSGRQRAPRGRPAASRCRPAGTSSSR